MSLERRNLILLSLCGLLLCGCADLLNLTVPRSGYTVHRDIAYGADARQQLDIYVPNTPAPGHPVVVFFYGGSWQEGSKKDYLFAGQALASRGFTTVIADYRLYPQVYFPAFMEDAAAAFAWTHAHIGEYGGNADAMFVSGHSAGGYIALMLTLNDAYLKQAHAERSWIKGAIGIAGPYDFLPFTDPNIKALFSKAPDAATQPINYVRPGMPPVLLLHGDEDTEVLPRNTLHLAQALRRDGDEVQMRIYPGVAHIGIVLSFASGFRGKATTLDDITQFIRAHSAGAMQ